MAKREVAFRHREICLCLPSRPRARRSQLQLHPAAEGAKGMPEERSTAARRPVAIVDLGRGPQIEGHRLTVMDVFYYLHRGYDFDFIHQAMPSLTRDQFDAVVEYVGQHHDELVEKDRRVEELNRRGVEAQR